MEFPVPLYCCFRNTYNQESTSDGHLARAQTGQLVDFSIFLYVLPCSTLLTFEKLTLNKS